MKNISTQLILIVLEMESAFSEIENAVYHWETFGFLNQQYLLGTLADMESQLLALQEIPSLSVTPYGHRVEMLLKKTQDLGYHLCS